MSRDFSLALGGVSYKIIVDGNSILVNGQPFVVGFEAGSGRVLVDGTPYDVLVDAQAARAVVGGIEYSLEVEGLAGEESGPKRGAAPVATEGAVTAIMPGKIIRVMVAEGDEVAEGDIVCILEAMKMENELRAPKEGVVARLFIQPGQDAETGMVLAEIE
ncbi:biotin/lipoyl-containing protein [Chloroflexota bacterium]